MEKPTSQLVEEAVLAIKQGEINLETGATRFGAAWPEIKGEVALILDLGEAGQFFKTSLPASNLDKIWSQILPELTLVEVLPVAANGINHNHSTQPDIVKVSRPENPPKPVPQAVTPVKEPTPISIPARKSGTVKWRKPLAWAAAIALIVVLSLGSLVGVANAAEPGDLFYGTKLWLDNARQVVAFSPQDKRDFALSYCNHRSQEMEWLVKNNKLQYLPEVAADYQQTLQKAFTSDKTALSSDQASQIKTQQARLTQLSGQLSSVNAAAASQASAEVNKLVQQLDDYETLPQNSPAPTATPGTPTNEALTPSVSPGTASPAITMTITVTGTTVSEPAFTPALTSPAAISPTIGISGTTLDIQAPPSTTVVAPPASTLTATPATGNSGSKIVQAYNPTPNPTQVVSSNNGDNGNDNQANSSKNDSGSNPGSSYGNGNQQNTGNGSQPNNSEPKTPPTHPVLPTHPAQPTPKAKPVPPTATPVVAPTPTPVVTSTIIPVVAATVTPVVTSTVTPVITSTSTPVVAATPTPTAAPTDNPIQTIIAPGNSDNGNNGNNGNQQNPAKEPKTEKPADTPKPDKTNNIPKAAKTENIKEP